MPRISDERRAARRSQVLEAARACLQEHGLEAVSMEMIIARSGLSTGAVYGYFKGKDDIISAVVTEGTADLGAELLPVLADPAPLSPPELLGRVLRAVVAFGRRTQGVDRLLVSIHGWSHAQADPELKKVTAASYRRLRDAYTRAAARSQDAGNLDVGVAAQDVGQLLTSITLGFVAQRALTGSADVEAHVAALGAILTQPPSARSGQSGSERARTGSRTAPGRG